MKSHSCANHTPSGHGSTDFSPIGISGVPESLDPLQAGAKAKPSSRTASGTSHPSFRYCSHVTAAGRHCRMLALLDSELCDHHDRAQAKRRQKQPCDNPMTGILARIPHFEDPAGVHHFIGDVVKQFAARQISRQDALAMGYLCQLLLTSFADHRKWRMGHR